MNEVTVGTIFQSRWGYDQTNIGYYEVVAMTPSGKSARLRKLSQEVVDKDELHTWEMVVPGNAYTSLVFTKKLSQDDTHGASFKVAYSEYAWVWDGKPKHQTGPLSGH
jgi:hypothetical protein